MILPTIRKACFYGIAYRQYSACVSRCSVLRLLENSKSAPVSFIRSSGQYEKFKPKNRVLAKQFCSRSSFNCWNCGHTSSSYHIFCANCNKIQDFDDTFNYFDVLGIPHDFEVDISNLTKKFRSLQAILHPDKFSQKSEKEQELSALQSGRVNTAYRTLLQPVPRAEYMLGLRGAALEEGQVVMDQEFLMEIMELNEELDEAEDKEAVARLGQRNKATRDALIQAFSAALRSADIAAARSSMARLKYHDNLHAKVVAYERRHGIVAD